MLSVVEQNPKTTKKYVIKIHPPIKAKQSLIFILNHINKSFYQVKI